MNHIQLLLLTLALPLAGCAKREHTRIDLFNGRLIREEYHSTRREFLEPPVSDGGVNFLTFLGCKGATLDVQVQEWKALRETQLDVIMREAERESFEIFNRGFLERSGASVGVDVKPRLDRVVNAENITSLEYLIATREMQKRLATDMALLLSYRELVAK
jgi:hypothetical protein